MDTYNYTEPDTTPSDSPGNKKTIDYHNAQNAAEPSPKSWPRTLQFIVVLLVVGSAIGALWYYKRSVTPSSLTPQPTITTQASRQDSSFKIESSNEPANLNSLLPNATRQFASGAFDTNIFVDLAKKVIPGVVNISTFGLVQPMMQQSPDDLFRFFFEDFFGGQQQQIPPRQAPAYPNQKPRKRPLGLGTGFIIDASGLIVTNNHVVGDADEIKIRFTEDPKEQPTEGEVIGRDQEVDVALIRVKTNRKLTALPFGDSDALQVGEFVMAAGNPFGRGHSVTQGIISAKGREAPGLPLARYIQTDAPINPGNSGGPLVNLKGEVIGVNNAIDARAQGIGFAIPSNLVKKIVPQLRDKGTVERGYIGILINEMTPELAKQLGVPENLQAPFITQVQEGEPADKAGLKPYDVITEVNGHKIETSYDLIREVSSIPVGENTKIKVLRNGDSKTFDVTVSKRPGEQTVTQNKKQKSKKDKSEIDTGMELQSMNAQIARQLGFPHEIKGAVVTSIIPGSPAAEAGLSERDVIVEVNRKAIKSAAEFFRIVKEKKSYLLRIRRVIPSGADVFSVVILDLKEE